MTKLRTNLMKLFALIFAVAVSFALITMPKSALAEEQNPVFSISGPFVRTSTNREGLSFNIVTNDAWFDANPANEYEYGVLVYPEGNVVDTSKTPDENVDDVNVDALKLYTPNTGVHTGNQSVAVGGYNLTYMRSYLERKGLEVTEENAQIMLKSLLAKPLGAIGYIKVDNDYVYSDPLTAMSLLSASVDYNNDYFVGEISKVSGYVDAEGNVVADNYDASDAIILANGKGVIAKSNYEIDNGKIVFNTGYASSKINTTETIYVVNADSTVAITVDYPTFVSTPEQFLAAMDRDVFAPSNETLKIENNKIVYLTQNINMLGYTLKNSKGIKFTGKFDGRGYYVSNLEVASYANNVNGGHGIFGDIVGTVKNVAFPNLSASTWAYYFSPFASEMSYQSSKIENVYVEINDLGNNKAGLGIINNNAFVINVVVKYNEGTTYNTFDNYQGAIAYNNGDKLALSKRIDNVYAISSLPVTYDHDIAYYGENETAWIDGVTAKNVANVRRYNSVNDIKADTSAEHSANLEEMVATGMWVNVDGVPVFKSVNESYVPVANVTVTDEVDYETSSGKLKYNALAGKKIISVNANGVSLTEANDGIINDNGDYSLASRLTAADTFAGVPFITSSSNDFTKNKMTFKVVTEDTIYTFTNVRYWNEVIETPEEFTAALDKTVSPYNTSSLSDIAGTRGLYMVGWFKLACDIDMTGVAYSGDTTANGLPYNRSNFDGYGHTVSNLTVTGKQAFGMIYFNWQNVNFVNYTGTLFHLFDNGSKITNVYFAKAGATGRPNAAANRGTVTETNVVWANVDTLIDGVVTSANGIKIPLNTDTKIALKLNGSSVENAEITNVSITALDNNVVVEGNNIKLIDMAGGKVKLSYEIAGFTVNEVLNIGFRKAEITVSDEVDFDKSTGKILYDDLEGQTIEVAKSTKGNNTVNLTINDNVLSGVQFTGSRNTAITANKHSFYVETETTKYTFSNVRVWDVVIDNADEFYNTFEASVTQYKSAKLTEITGSGTYMVGWFKLNADVDMADYTWYGGGIHGTPYGYFNFDGYNHTVSNLTVTKKPDGGNNYNYSSVFNSIYGVFQNVKFVNTNGYISLSAQPESKINNVLIEGDYNGKAFRDTFKPTAVSNLVVANVKVTVDELTVGGTANITVKKLLAGTVSYDEDQSAWVWNYDTEEANVDAVISTDSNLITIENGVITAGSEAGEAEITVTYTISGYEVTEVVKVTINEAAAE